MKRFAVEHKLADCGDRFISLTELMTEKYQILKIILNYFLNG